MTDNIYPPKIKIADQRRHAPAICKTCRCLGRRHFTRRHTSRLLDHRQCGRHTKGRLHQSAQRPLAGFGEPDPYVIGLVRKALANGLAVGGKTYQVEIIDKDTQSDPARAGQLAKELITSGAHRFHADHVDARNRQSGFRRLRGSRCAMPLDRNAVGGMVFRSRSEAERAFAVQVDIPFQFRREKFSRLLRFAMERVADKQKSLACSILTMRTAMPSASI